MAGSSDTWWTSRMDYELCLQKEYEDCSVGRVSLGEKNKDSNLTCYILFLFCLLCRVHIPWCHVVTESLQDSLAVLAWSVQQCMTVHCCNLISIVLSTCQCWRWDVVTMKVQRPSHMTTHFISCHIWEWCINDSDENLKKYCNKHRFHRLQMMTPSDKTTRFSRKEWPFCVMLLSENISE